MPSYTVVVISMRAPVRSHKIFRLEVKPRLFKNRSVLNSRFPKRQNLVDRDLTTGLFRQNFHKRGRRGKFGVPIPVINWMAAIKSECKPWQSDPCAQCTDWLSGIGKTNEIIFRFSDEQLAPPRFHTQITSIVTSPESNSRW